jgi:hypothetical protein
MKPTLFSTCSLWTIDRLLFGARAAQSWIF